MKYHLVSLVAICLTLAACAHVDQGTTFQYDNESVDKLDTSRKFTVAVVPFTINPEIRNDQFARLHEFECNFLAARLSARLAASPVVSDAFVTPEFTPAADFEFKGEVLQSDGRKTKVAVSMFAGMQLVWTKEFEIMLGFSDFGRSLDPSASIWSGPTHEFEKTVASPDAKLAELTNTITAYRVQQYGEGKNSEKVISAAVDVERRLLLTPLTRKITSQADAVSVLYINWQRETTRNIEDRNVARAQTVYAAVDTAFAVVTVGAALIGNTNSAVTTLTAANTAEAIKTLQASSEQVSYLSDRIAAINTEFTKASEPVTVTFLGSSHKLAGTYLNQLQQFGRSSKLPARRLERVTDLVERPDFPV